MVSTTAPNEVQGVYGRFKVVEVQRGLTAKAGYDEDVQKKTSS